MVNYSLNVMGVPYTVHIGLGSELGEEFKDEKLCGNTDYYSKEIRIRTDLNSEGASRRGLLECTYRHEVCHAFMYECGLVNIAMDEMIVDWLEVNLPKLFNLLNSTYAGFFSVVEQVDRAVKA